MKPINRLLSAFVICCAVVLNAQNVGYVVDNAAGRVLVVDLATQTVRMAIPTSPEVAPEASELLILPNNRYAFVSNQASADVGLLDLVNNVRVIGIPTGEGPGSMIATPDGRFLYVANVISNTVTVIDVNQARGIAGIEVGTSPVQVNMSHDGRYAYAVNQGEPPTVPGTISVIDTNRNQVVKTVPVGVSPNQFAILPNLNTAYVINTGSNSVSLFDLVQNEVTGEIPVGQGPVSVAFSSDSTKLYVVNRGSNNISVVDTQQNKEITKIPVGMQPMAMVVTFDSMFGFVSNSGSNTVTLVDLNANTKELDIAVGSQPFSLMLDPDENFLFVTNIGSGSVSVIDVNQDRVTRTIPVGGSPVQFTMLNAPTLLELAPNPASPGQQLTLSGESLLPASTVRFTTPSGTIPVQPPQYLDSQGLTVTVPAFPGASAIVDVLHEDGNSSERITLRNGTPAVSINPGGVVEGAGFARAPAPISGNSFVSIFGNFPGMAYEVATSFPLPLTMGNTTVTFNGVPAPLFATIPEVGQINLVAPVRLFALEQVRVAITVNGQTSAAETVNVAPTSPGNFVIFLDGTGAFLHDPDVVVTSLNPASRGERIAMFVTGLGNTSPPPLDREQAPVPPAETVLKPTVTVGGITADVFFSGLAPCCSGLYQINFDVPLNSAVGNDVPVVVSIGGRTSNTVNLAVK
jgi:uncharacterized protein (TIGR03437 family)